MGHWQTTRRGRVSRFGSNSKGCIAHGEATIASFTESTQRGIACRSWPSSTARTLTGRDSSTDPYQTRRAISDAYRLGHISTKEAGRLRHALDRSASGRDQRSIPASGANEVGQGQAHPIWWTRVPLSVVDGTIPQVMMTRETMARCAIPAMPLKELELDPCLASGVGPHLPAPHPFGTLARSTDIPGTYARGQTGTAMVVVGEGEVEVAWEEIRHRWPHSGRGYGIQNGDAVRARGHATAGRRGCRCRWVMTGSLR